MSTTIPAMKGKLGSTEYYLTTMKASEVARLLTIPSTMPDWEEMSQEEVFQRDINYSRVKKEIAPYLAHDDDRFYSAIIVDIYSAAELEWEDLTAAASNVDIPRTYHGNLKAFGFLHLSGGEQFVPLDGQHRLCAIQFALSGRDEKSNEIPDLTPNLAMGEDDVTLILVHHDKLKSRKIFSKVNRYAKPTNAATNLIISDDDFLAVYSRNKVVKELIGSERLVNYKSNTINNSNLRGGTPAYFTTLSTIYSINTSIVSSRLYTPYKSQIIYAPETRAEMDSWCTDFWQNALDYMEYFGRSIENPDEDGDADRDELRNSFACLKPVVQLGLAHAFILLTKNGDDGTTFTPAEAFQRLNALPWDSTEELWQGVIFIGGNIRFGKGPALQMGRMFAYLAGQSLSDVELTALENMYLTIHPQGFNGSGELPPRQV